MKRYEVLGREVHPESQFDLMVEGLEKDREIGMGCPNVSYRVRHIEALSMYPCFKQMQFLDLPDITAELREGLELVTDYFHGDWWTEEAVRRVELESPDLLRLSKWNSVEQIIQVNRLEMDRSNSECRFSWHDELRVGILFGGLLGEWDQVAHICSALGENTPVEYSAGTIVDEYFQWWLCVAGQLSGKSNDRYNHLLDGAKQCRQKRLRLEIAAWEAACSGNQKEFDKAYAEAVKAFVKRKEDPSECWFVAMDESVIWLIASRQGLTFPKMPDKLKAAVMTRETLDLLTD